MNGNLSREIVAMLEASRRAARHRDQARAHRATRLRALHDAALLVAEPVPGEPRAIGALLGRIVAGAVAALGAADGTLVLAEDHAWRRLVPGARTADGQVTVGPTGRVGRLPVAAEGEVARVLAHGSAVAVADTLAHPSAAHRELAARGIRAFSIVALRARRRVTGALSLSFAEPGHRADDDVETLELFAAHAAAAVERARLAHRDRQRASQAEQLAATLAEVGAASDEAEALEALLRGSLKLLGATQGEARLVDPGTGAVRLRRWMGAGGGLDTAVTSEQAAVGSFGELLQAGAAGVLVDDVAALASERAPEYDSLRRQGVRSAVVAPIRVAGRRTGSLAAGHAEPGYFETADVRLAEAMAAQAGAVIAQAERARLDGALLVARTVAHEINNAISPVAGYARLLAGRPEIAGDAGLVSQVEQIGAAASSAAQKVAQLQRIVRLEPSDTFQGLHEPLLDLERSTSPGPQRR